MQLDHTLTELGLSKHETKVYLALLELDSASVSQIAKVAGTKRSTTYLALDSLVERELATQLPSAGKKLYRVLPPARLVEQLQQKTRLATQLVPMLLSLQSHDTLVPKVRLYEGKQQVRALYRELGRRITQADRPASAWFADLDAIEAALPGELDRFFQLEKKRRSRKRELVKDTPLARSLFARYSYPKLEHRFLPKSTAVDIDFGILGSTVAIFSFKSPLFGLLIEHKGIANSFRSLFDLAWEQGHLVTTNRYAYQSLHDRSEAGTLQEK